MNNYQVSKTSFLKLEQCHKAFYLYKKHPYLRDKPGTDKLLTFKRGHDVGYYAWQLFPGGKDVSALTKNKTEALSLTAELIHQKENVIYEATFVYNGALVMADILVRSEEKYTAFEIKSSLKISETYVKDACLQYYVIKNCLPELDDLFLVTLNPDYILEEETEPKKLFRRRSMKSKAESNFTYFENRLREADLLIEQNNIPNIAVGKHCFRPYQCDFFGTCWKEILNPQSIFNMPLVDKTLLFDLYNNGIKTIDGIPDETLNKEHLLTIKSAILKSEPCYNPEEISRFISGLTEPVMTLDMEIWGPAIPQIKGTRPFEQVPFLASCYNGHDYTHVFVAHQGDERRAFAEQLIALTSGANTLVVYDKTMELQAIQNLRNLFPDLDEALENVKNKLMDVAELFIGASYYHPAFKNNFSLKAICAVLIDDVSYGTINSGLEAMNVFDTFRNEANNVEKNKLKLQLLDYCNMDAYCTHRLLSFLKNLV